LPLLSEAVELNDGKSKRDALELQPAAARPTHAAMSAKQAPRPESDKNDARRIPPYAPKDTRRRQVKRGCG
jgi:hypothetical protein